MISLQIVTYNSEKTIGDCIKSIPQDNLKEIIIIDNASKDGTLSLLYGLKKEFPSIRIIENKENLGFGKAHNQGALLATGDILLLLNPDTRFEAGDFSEIEPLPMNALYGFKFLNSNKSLQYTLGRDPTSTRIITDRVPLLQKICGMKIRTNHSYRKAHEVDWVHGCGLAVSKKLFLEIGGFNEKFFMYCEDIELCKRAREKGYSVHYWPKLSFIHLKEGMLPKNRPLKYFYIRKGLVFIFQMYPKLGSIKTLRFIIRAEVVLMQVLTIFSSNQKLWRDWLRKAWIL